ncbi:dienelactone hydrolase family protein [Paraflavisolibacter sp. H34]|uniref:alpha/beta hydrolase n=1 Tax=Huijunlia imazamoxiresistens TaxID=3127457 RepID=UPI003018833D
MHQKKIITAGKALDSNSKVLILLHGRGGSAEDILSLASYLKVDDFTLLAPQATNNTWYPLSFLAPPAQNEPWLSSALSLLEEVVEDVQSKGVPAENIYFCGFSQGACLTLEFVTRHAARYGGVAAFTGGLIGDRIYPGNYQGDFAGTPVFIGSSNPDPHVPVERVYATANILRDKNAAVTEKIYNGMGHTINPDEIQLANSLVFAPKTVNQ